MKYHIDFDIDFKRNTTAGFYIALEGIDGSGKSTQVQQVTKRLQAEGKDVLIMNEPSNTTVVGKLIREILQSRVAVPAVSLQYLFTADRAIQAEQVLQPALEQGKIVLSHRCFWSAIPYGILDQSNHDKDYDYSKAEQILAAQGILSFYHQFMVPDLTIYLDIAVDSAVKRLSQMDKTKEIYEKRDKLEKIASGYQWLLEKFPKEFTVVNAEKPVDAITEEIMTRIQTKNETYSNG